MRVSVLRYCCFILLLLSCCRANAQQWALRLHCIDSAAEANAPTIDFKSNTELISHLHRFVPDMQEKGYLLASIDSMSINGNSYELFYFKGKQYFWGELRFDAIPAALWTAAGVSTQQFDHRPLNPKAIARISERLLQYCENNGYPFAKIWLSEVHELSPQKISAKLELDRAERRTIDSILINGEVKITHAFLHRYLDMQKGATYNESKLKAISQRLHNLAYLQEASPWVLHFRPGDSRLSLFLKEKKANQLNALLGLMPNNLATGKLLLTADVQLALQNLLGHGESISASYQNLQAKSPRMKVDIAVPYLVQSAFGAEVHFDYFMNNLQFRKVSLQAGLRYQINSNDFVKLFYQTLSNRIITVDTASLIATKQLPANIDTRANGLGFEWQSNHVDYQLNPHRGWEAKLGTTAMQRKILANSALSGIDDGTGFDYGSLYDTVQKSSIQYFFNANLATYLPLARSLTLKIGYSGAYIATPQIFQNELFQIGGFKLMRGFDEQSIFANQYHLLTTELRLLLSQNSYAYLFSDNAWVQTKFSNYDRTAIFNGFGLGTTLETKTGLFSIALAFGRSDFIPLKFRESKILFGYVALF